MQCALRTGANKESTLQLTGLTWTRKYKIIQTGVDLYVRVQKVQHYNTSQSGRMPQAHLTH